MTSSTVFVFNQTKYRVQIFDAAWFRIFQLIFPKILKNRWIFEELWRYLNFRSSNKNDFNYHKSGTDQLGIFWMHMCQKIKSINWLVDAKIFFYRELNFVIFSSMSHQNVSLISDQTNVARILIFDTNSVKPSAFDMNKN